MMTHRGAGARLDVTAAAHSTSPGGFGAGIAAIAVGEVRCVAARSETARGTRRMRSRFIDAIIGEQKGSPTMDPRAIVWSRAALRRRCRERAVVWSVRGSCAAQSRRRGRAHGPRA
jgi:hypothetical protein